MHREAFGTLIMRNKVLVIAASAWLGAPVATLPQNQPGQPTPLPQRAGKASPSGSLGRPEAVGPALNTSVPNVALAATAVTPVAVTLNWQPAAGVASYTVLRNGARVTQIAADQHSYRDNTVKPQNSYSYQLQFFGARTPGGVALNVPITTPAVQVSTPPVAPPDGLTATLVSPSAVRLTWNPRPDSIAYQITRNGQTFRVGLATPLAFNDSGLGPGTVTYSVQTIARTFDGMEIASAASPALNVRVGPFNLVTIGDSVMWGQGLSEPAKFRNQVQTWIANQLGGRPVRPINFSHSGALLGADPSDRARVPGVPLMGGEVPEDFPSVINQALVLVPQQVAPSDVDLILMDGCINDVTVANLLNPTVSDDTISALATATCGTQMEANLEAIQRKYPHARIIVTGYYQIVSPMSDLTAVTLYASNIGALAGGIAAAFGLPVDPVTGLVVGSIGSQVIRDKAVGHSALFQAMSTSQSMTATLTANSRLHTNQIKFVVPPFAQPNSYASPNTWLWLIPAPPTPPNLFDQVYLQRSGICAQMGKAMPASCIPASGGHPNPAGAMAYANAITAALIDALPQWKAQFATVQRGQ